MTNPSLQKNKATSYLLAVVLSSLVACAPAERTQLKEKQMTEKQSTLWQTIDALAQQMPLTPAKVEAVMGTKLQEQERSENFVHLKASGPALSDGLKVTEISLLTRPNNEFDIKSGLSLELSGACVKLDEIRKQFGKLEITQSPRGRSPLESTVHASKESWGTLSFAFKEENPDCLFRVSFRK